MSYYHKNLSIVLTARMGSERLPGKALINIAGRPLLEWIIKRLEPLGEVILCTTRLMEDEPLCELARRLNIPLYKRPDPNDVVGAIQGAMMTYKPNAEYVLRMLGDCPLPTVPILSRMVDVLEDYKSDVFLFHLPSYALPLYGSRETPYSAKAWEKVYKKSTEREHVDNYLQRHREEFKAVYHEAPANIYFRPYRVEVDWMEDVELFRAIATDGPGMLASTEDIVKWLDEHSEIANINHNRTEKTGPTVSFTYTEQRKWTKQMVGKPVVMWDDSVWNPPTPNAVPIFCKAGTCFIGYGDNGILHAGNGRIRSAYMTCECGANLMWHPRKSTQ